MTTEAQPSTCQHQREVELLTQLALARYPQAGTASVLASKMATDEKMAACQAECGDASPYRDVELHPIAREDAVALVERSHYGYFDVLVEVFGDIGRSMRDGIRRVFRRPPR